MPSSKEILEIVAAGNVEQRDKTARTVPEKDPQGLGEKFTPTMAIHEHVDEKMANNIFAGLLNMYTVVFEYDTASDKPISVAVENMAKGFQESIRNWKEKKIMFSAPVYVKRGDGAILDYLISKLNHLMNKDANINENDKRKLEPIWSEICDLVSKGNYVSEEVSKFLPEDILKKREDYLSSLKAIVRSSVENGEEEDIVVQRDNVFYCVACSEKSAITPAKFLSNLEFQNLDGALKFGEGGVIRIKNGQYHDMKGKVKMTFKVGDDEKIEMILSSENASSFGKMVLRMDDKSCEIFSKYLKDLETEPRISKVVEAAKSFVQNKSPLSSVDDANVQQLQSNLESLQISGQSLG